MCFKCMISSFGFLLTRTKYVMMGVELSISGHSVPTAPPKKDKHNLTKIGKSMKMKEGYRFSVRVSRVHC